MVDFYFSGLDTNSILFETNASDIFDRLNCRNTIHLSPMSTVFLICFGNLKRNQIATTKLHNNLVFRLFSNLHLEDMRTKTIKFLFTRIRLTY